LDLREDATDGGLLRMRRFSATAAVGLMTAAADARRGGYWLGGGGDGGGGREYWRRTIAGSFLFFLGASLWDPNKALTFRSLAFFKMQSLSLLPL